MKAWIVITGVVLMILSIIVAAALFIPGMLSLEDPTEDNIAEIESGESVDLKEGAYEIWCEEDPGEITIRGPDGIQISTEEPMGDLGAMGTKLYYLFEVDEEGSHSFTYDSDETIIITKGYITNPSILLIPGSCCCGGAVFFTGLILLIVGLVVKRK